MELSANFPKVYYGIRKMIKNGTVKIIIILVNWYARYFIKSTYLQE